MAVMEFQESIVSVVSSGFPYEFVMNLPYTSFITLLDIIQRTRAKRNLEMLYLMTAPHGDGSLVEQLLTEHTTTLATYSAEATPDEIAKDIENFNAYLGGLS